MFCILSVVLITHSLSKVSPFPHLHISFRPVHAWKIAKNISGGESCHIYLSEKNSSFTGPVFYSMKSDIFIFFYPHFFDCWELLVIFGINLWSTVTSRLSVFHHLRLVTLKWWKAKVEELYEFVTWPFAPPPPILSLPKQLYPCLVWHAYWGTQ